jgi:hypothetical protein
LATEVIYDKIRLIAGLVPQSAHGVQLNSSCKFFLELLGCDEYYSLKGQVYLIICSYLLMTVFQQQLWSPHYPKFMVIPDVHHLNLKLPLANRFNHRCAVRSFTAPLPSTSQIFFAAAVAL